MLLEVVFKIVDGVKISYDIHLPDSHANQPLPVIVWYHGGGLLQGTRKGVAPHLLSGVRRGQFALCSVDYRLAPQVKLPDILEDCLDAIEHIRRHGDSLVGRDILDLRQLSVSGSSAGGYLALLAAMRDSKLRSCLAIYPITDPLGDFFTTPQPLGKDSYDAESLKAFIDPGSAIMTSSGREHPRSKMYYYMLDKANLANLLGVDRGSQSLYSVPTELRKGKSICPVFLVHGDADQAVGVEQSRELAEALAASGADYQYLELPGIDHLFDQEASVTLSEMFAFHNEKVVSHQDEIDDSDILSSAGVPSAADPTAYSSSSSDADEQWEQQMHELSLALNLILLPLAGKYFGRQAAFYAYGRFMEWRFPVRMVVDNPIAFRGSGAAIATGAALL